MPSQHTFDYTYLDDSYVELKVHCNGERLSYGTIYTRAVPRTEIERNWSNTPNFLALRRDKKRLPDRSYNYVRYSRGTSGMSYLRDSGPSSTCPFPNWELARLLRTDVKHPGYYVRPYESERIATEYEAISRLFERAKGAEFSMPIFFGEARETIRMVASTARTLADSYLKLRRGNLKGAFATLQMQTPTVRLQRSFNRQYGRDARKAARNHWLQMQLGWMPLLMDVKNAAEQLGEYAMDDRKTVGRVTSRTEYTRVQHNPNTVIEVSPSGKADRSSRITESFRYTWLFSPTGLNDLGSIGLLNPLSVAWNLAPSSFVVDYLLPIGRYLEHLDVPLRFTHVGGTSGYARKVESTYTNFRWDGANGVGPVYNDSFLYVSRDKLNSIPHLGLNSIRFEPKLGVKRLLNILALSSKAFKD